MSTMVLFLVLDLQSLEKFAQEISDLGTHHPTGHILLQGFV
jgi:hypothetical protein